MHKTRVVGGTELLLVGVQVRAVEDAVLVVLRHCVDAVVIQVGQGVVPGSGTRRGRYPRVSDQG